VYAARGRYQLYVTSLHPVGRGALEIAFRQLHAKLAAEGLFATERKRPLPRFPLRVALVTSRSTAALQDMLKVLRRFTWLRLMLYDVPVQGDGAAGQIAAALNHLSKSATQSQIDVILLGRGGGSLEDLWEFNEEIVARAIAASKIPTVAAVGHEIDFTIADFVADLRAPTPTAAAELILPRKRDLREQLRSLDLRLLREMASSVDAARENLQAWVKRLADPGRKLRENQQRLDDLSIELVKRFRERARQSRNRLAELAGRLGALSPLAVLDRGYAIAHKLPEEQIVKSAATLQTGDLVRVTFAEGQALCRVEEKK
jgi:exodeoxyribonuclease VII large subunit